MNTDSLSADCTIDRGDSNNFIDDQLALKINDIDDLAIAWIAIEKNNELVLHDLEGEKNADPESRKETPWLWKSGGRHGNGEINITQWLLDHQSDILDNVTEFYLVIVIYDFPYDKFVSAGKWSFDATLEKNSIAIWHKHDFGKSDTENKKYGPKYLKIIKMEIEKTSESKRKIPKIIPESKTNDNKKCDPDYSIEIEIKGMQESKKNKIKISEIVPESIIGKISNRIETRYNYKTAQKFIDDDGKKEDTPITKKSNNSLLKKILNIMENAYIKNTLNIMEISFVISLYILGLLYNEDIFKDIHLYYKDFNLLHHFIFYNILFLLYFFFRYKLGGMAWTLVLKKKHNKELDTFMVILGLLFSAAFGSITSFEFDGNKLSNVYYLIGIFSLYITTNLVLLYVLTVVSTYITNTLSANKKMVFILIIFIGVSIFIQETINFEHNYHESNTSINQDNNKSNEDNNESKK